jgi:TRAP-type C4-dicarboxylate transport system permease large subunit
LRFSAPTAYSQHEAAALLPADCHIHKRSAPSGFLNLLALSSAPCLLALFHARSAPGVLLSRAFSLRVGANCLQLPAPHAVVRITRPSRKTSLKRHNASTASRAKPYI